MKAYDSGATSCSELRTTGRVSKLHTAQRDHRAGDLGGSYSPTGERSGKLAYVRSCKEQAVKSSPSAKTSC
jgi:hypothetical protein